MRALIACLLWLAGVEVLPAVHLAHHDAASHHHDGDQIVADDHDDHADHDDHHDGEIPQTEADHPEHDHGAGGLAHHATALAPAKPPITAPVPVDRHELFVVAAVSILLVSTIGLTPSARGPPSSTSRSSVPNC